MLSGLSKRRIPILKSSKPVVHSYRRFLASTPIRSAKPGIVANKPHYFAEGDTLGNDPNLSNSALRSAGEHFWAESEIQLPKKRIQLKRAAGDKLRRSDENKQFIPLGTPQNTRNTWEKYPAERTPSKRARSSNTDLGIQQRNGLSRNSSAKNISVRHQEGAIVAHASQFLIIRDFKGVRSDLVKAVSSYMAAQLYLVPTRIDEKKARIDVLIKFATQDDAVNARSLLERLKTSLVQEPLTVEMIDETQYLSVLNPPKPTPSMERLVIQSEQKNDQNYRGLSLQTLRASSTLWIGNVPAELLEDKREIVAKFSKYGQVIDVKIPDKQNNRPRGNMQVQFLWQEDADACYKQLTQTPLYLFGRPLHVDYVVSQGPERLPFAPNPMRVDSRSYRTVHLSNVPASVMANPWGLLDSVVPFGEVVDLRFGKSSESQNGTAFVDFLHSHSAQNMIKSISAGKMPSLGAGVCAKYGTRMDRLEWDSIMCLPSDTLRIWGLPLRALDEALLREAFARLGNLIHIRISKKNGWPTGAAYLQFGSIDDAKRVLNWIRSYPQGPITFYGREIRANFTDHRKQKRRTATQKPMIIVATGEPTSK